LTVVAPPRPPSPPSPEDLEALIEEARRRARRRRAAYGTCLLLLGLALGLYFGIGHGGGGRRPSRNASSAPGGAGGQAKEAQRIVAVGARTIIGEAGVAAPGVGWAMNGLGLWWTRDGGKSWRASVPPQVASTGDVVARVADIAAVDDEHVWVAAADVQGNKVVNGSPRQMAIERSQDGGKTWQSVIPPGCYGCGGAQLSFVDVRHGFALTGIQPEPRLYETRDGGRSWRRLGTDASFAGPIHFLDGRDGWAVSEPGRMTGPSQSVPVGGGILYRTSDGGHHWRRVALAPPARYRGQPATASLPRFFGRRDGVVGVRFRDRSRAQQVVVYVTHDGGDSWSARPAPAAVDLRAESWGFPQALPFSAASAKDWFLLVGPMLYTTTDGGRTWSTTRTVAPKPPRVWDLAFSSPSEGWAIFALVVNGPRAGAALVKTSDGGRHWTPLAPH
jgi:photosystem II stability/assembly factor-like uncharacterized protein